MIVTDPSPITGDQWAFHSRIISGLVEVADEREKGIRSILAQEVPIVRRLISQHCALRKMSACRGVDPSELQHIPIFTEVDVFLAPDRKVNYFPLLSARAAELREPMQVVAASLQIERGNILELCDTYNADARRQGLELTRLELSNEHEAIDTLRDTLNDQITRLKSVIGSF